MKVSIITVCYNSEATIRDTIESVLAQDHQNLEYIVIDGQSTDKTVEILQSYGDRITHFISEADRGMYDGLNKGIQLASGEVVGMINADDFYIDNKVVSDVVSCLEKERADTLYADLYYVDSIDTNQIKRYWQSGEYKQRAFLKGWMPPHPTFFIRKRFYEKYGGFRLELKSAADYELMLRMLHKHQLSVAYLKRVIVKMRIGGMSNASLKNRLRANREDRKAWELNDLKPGAFTFLYKPLRKLIQFVKRK